METSFTNHRFQSAGIVAQPGKIYPTLSTLIMYRRSMDSPPNGAVETNTAGIPAVKTLWLYLHPLCADYESVLTPFSSVGVPGSGVTVGVGVALSSVRSGGLAG